MKIMISEKHFKKIVKSISLSQEIDEVEDTASGGSAGYPQVGKWEGGVTRGPANQIGLTKWSDIVGSSLKRGKANQLK